MTAPRPGWYPDPSGRGGAFRWWDGNDWTGRTRNKLPRRNNRLVVLLLGLSLVLSGAVVGLIGWKSYRDAGPSGRHPVSGAAAPKPTTRAGRSSPTQPAGQLDETTRQATLANGWMVLPGRPYELVAEPESVPGVFDAMFVANAPVHLHFNGSDTWAATVGLGHIPADAWSQDDLHGFARKALNGFSRQFFGYRPTSVKKIDYSAAMVSGRTCARITADVHYEIKKLASRYDRLVIIGCPADNGSVIAAISSVPDDAPPQLTALAAESLATLALR